ncbi:MAG: hypothetical protein JWQ09_4436 [Segetibacter sp.]|nr:hypothetical protein [Segetibacter sp.]
MKKTIISTLAIPFILTIILAFKFDKNLNEFGAIGDVKYSILSPDKFNQVNGRGWVLMNGSSTAEVADLFRNSELHNALQVPSLPDARGVFLRGMNKGREAENGDPDGERNVGDVQRDTFKSHTHVIYYFQGVHWDFSGQKFAGAVKPMMDGQGVAPGEPTGEKGGNETRPRNIALFVYIKIN